MVGGAGAVGTDGGARRAVGFGDAGIAAIGFGGAIGAGAAGRRTATFGTGRDGGKGLAIGGGERLIDRGGGATLAGAGGTIGRVAVPPGDIASRQIQLRARHCSRWWR